MLTTHYEKIKLETKSAFLGSLVGHTLHAGTVSLYLTFHCYVLLKFDISLAGMIHKVGLLPICNHQQVPFAYKMYTHTNDLGWKQSNAFKNSFSINVQVDFLGVWYVTSYLTLDYPA